MNIGELFVSLGIKGSDKTIADLDNTKKGLGGVASTSLEAKAAIVGAMYALERLFATSGAAGTGLTNFNALVGVSTQQLQQYQYAGRQVGITNETTAGTFKTLQSAMSKVLMGESAPKGLGLVAGFTGGITPKDIEKFAQQPALLLQRLQQYAGKDHNLGRRNEVLKSFGLGDDVIAGLSRQAFRPAVLSKAPTYNDKEIGALDRANIAWSNLGTHIEMAVGHFNAAHGGQLVKDFTMLTDQVLKLAGALTTLSEKMKLFETLGHAFEGLANTLKLVNELVTKFKGGESKKGDLLYQKPGEELIPGFSNSPAAKFLGGFIESLKTVATGFKPTEGQEVSAQKSLPPHKIVVPAIAPSMTHRAPARPAITPKTFNTTLHQTFQHDGKDAKRVGDSTKKAVQDAYRTLPQGEAS